MAYGCGACVPVDSVRWWRHRSQLRHVNQIGHAHRHDSAAGRLGAARLPQRVLLEHVRLGVGDDDDVVLGARPVAVPSREDGGSGERQGGLSIRLLARGVHETTQRRDHTRFGPPPDTYLFNVHTSFMQYIAVHTIVLNNQILIFVIIIGTIAVVDAGIWEQVGIHLCKFRPKIVISCCSFLSYTWKLHSSYTWKDNLTSTVFLSLPNNYNDYSVAMLVEVRIDDF